MPTFAVTVQAPANINGINRKGWLISSHGRDVEGFVIRENGRDDLSKGIEEIKGRKPKKTYHLDSGPYVTDIPIRVTVKEFNRLKALARERGTLVGV